MPDISLTVYADSADLECATHVSAWVASLRDPAVALIRSELRSDPWFHVTVDGFASRCGRDAFWAACLLGTALARQVWYEAHESWCHSYRYKSLARLHQRLGRTISEKHSPTQADGLQGGIGRADASAALATLEHYALGELADFYERKYAELDEEYYCEQEQRMQNDAFAGNDSDKLMRELGLTEWDFR